MNELTTYNSPLSIVELKQQVNLIQEVMRDVMHDGEHYGKVPGCGDKPSLLKAGAEKLAFVFRLAPKFIIKEEKLERGHIKIDVTCQMHKQDGTFLGEGVGSCSTMETKYRFRAGCGTLTDVVVPKAYWDNRQENPKAAGLILKKLANEAGHEGDKFGTKKEDGIWYISTFGDRVEHDNPADFYNTVVKMAKKRAQVDATLTCTAASDIFTQDIEEMTDLVNKEATPMKRAEPIPQPKQAPSPAKEEAQAEPESTEPPIDRLQSWLMDAVIDPEWILQTLKALKKAPQTTASIYDLSDEMILQVLETKKWFQARHTKETK